MGVKDPWEELQACLTWNFGPSLVLWLQDVLASDTGVHWNVLVSHYDNHGAWRGPRTRMDLHRTLEACVRLGLIATRDGNTYTAGEDLDSLGLVCSMEPEQYSQWTDQWGVPPRDSDGTPWLPERFRGLK